MASLACWAASAGREPTEGPSACSNSLHSSCSTVPVTKAMLDADTVLAPAGKRQNTFIPCLWLRLCFMVMPYLHLQLQARDRVLVGRFKHQEEIHQHGFCQLYYSCIGSSDECLAGGNFEESLSIR